MKNLGESQEMIEKLKEKNGSEESEEAVSKFITKNEKLTKRVKAMKGEQEHMIVRLSEVQDERGNAILESNQAYAKLRLA